MIESVIFTSTWKECAYSLFIKSRVSPLENSIHSFVGESAAVRWSIVKFSNYFWG